MKRLLFIFLLGLPAAACAQHQYRTTAVVSSSQLAAAVSNYLAANATPVVVPTGTPTAATPGTEGQSMMDDLFFYTYHDSAWKKSPRINL